MALSFISREQYENVDEVVNILKPFKNNNSSNSKNMKITTLQTYFVTLYTEYDVDYVNRCLGWRIDTTEIGFALLIQ